MTTIRIRVNEKVLDKVLWLLGRFSKEELEIVGEDTLFEANKRYLDDALNRMEQGKSQSFTIEEADIILEKAIKRNES
jgi:succinylglutamate desuccinylase